MLGSEGMGEIIAERVSCRRLRMRVRFRAFPSHTRAAPARRSGNRALARSIAHQRPTRVQFARESRSARELQFDCSETSLRWRPNRAAPCCLHSVVP